MGLALGLALGLGRAAPKVGEVAGTTFVLRPPRPRSVCYPPPLPNPSPPPAGSPTSPRAREQLSSQMYLPLGSHILFPYQQRGGRRVASRRCIPTTPRGAVLRGGRGLEVGIRGLGWGGPGLARMPGRLPAGTGGG